MNEDMRKLAINGLTIDISETLMTAFMYDGLVELVVLGGRQSQADEGELPPTMAYQLTAKGILTFACEAEVKIEAWAREVVDKYGYGVRFLPVGDVDPELGALLGSAARRVLQGERGQDRRVKRRLLARRFLEGKPQVCIRARDAADEHRVDGLNLYGSDGTGAGDE